MEVKEHIRIKSQMGLQLWETWMMVIWSSVRAW